MVTSTLAMKTLLRILAWSAVAAAVMWWPTRPTIWWPTRATGFNARWVSLPSAMTREMVITARKAAERPTGMTYTYCKWPGCRRG
jgi:hypothetical protein